MQEGKTPSTFKEMVLKRKKKHMQQPRCQVMETHKQTQRRKLERMYHLDLDELFSRAQYVSSRMLTKVKIQIETCSKKDFFFY